MKQQNMRKKYKVFTKNNNMLRSHSPCMFVFSSMWEEKKLSFMEAQKAKSCIKRVTITVTTD